MRSRKCLKMPDNITSPQPGSLICRARTAWVTKVLEFSDTYHISDLR